MDEYSAKLCEKYQQRFMKMTILAFEDINLPSYILVIPKDMFVAPITSDNR